MPTFYTDGDFTTAQQHGEVIVSYPLQRKFGDITAQRIERKMRVLKENFTPTAQGTALTGYTGSRLVSESKPVDISASVQEFVQVYATKPANKTLHFEGSNTWPFPSFLGVVYVPPASAEAANDSENLYKFIEIRGANGIPAPLYIDYTYFIKDSTPTVPTVFRPTLDGNAVDFISNGGSKSLVNARAANGEKFSATYTVPETVPNLTDYGTSITNGDLKIIDVQIEEYMGDIFVMKTLKMKAQ